MRSHGVPKTKALVALQAVAARFTQAGIAGRIGVVQQVVSSYLRRASRPGPEVREAIEREFGIPFDDWYTDAELRLAKGSVPSSSPRLAGRRQAAS